MRKSISIHFIYFLLVITFSSSVTAESSINPESVSFEAFFDAYLSSKMREHNIAGVTVSVVKGDRILFAKGYGHADMEQGVPVDPEKTLFRIGSLSKLFTWTAIMQLVEAGKLDLKADINTYLDFIIPATFPEPITINHLMSHSAGFEIRNYNWMAKSPEQVIPLGDWLKANIPTRVRPVGEISAYGNYGTGLAGYIIERVSGMPYHEYIDKNILKPLNMNYTSSRQPLPSHLRKNSTKCYIYGENQYQPYGTETVNVPPAASFHASGLDMGRFMIAHLNGGRFGNNRILGTETVSRMHQKSFSHDPRIPGWAHGFKELHLNGQNVLGHAGSSFVSASMMMLLPKERLGVFISSNSQGGATFLGAGYVVFHQEFMDHFFPRELPEIQSGPGFKERAKRYVGSYQMPHIIARTTPEKLFGGLLGVLKIRADDHGLVLGLPSGDTHFVEVEPLVFRQKDSESLLIFKEDHTGKVIRGFYSQIPLTAFEKPDWQESQTLNLTLLGICVALFISFPIVVIVQRLFFRRGQSREVVFKPEGSGLLMMVAACVLNILFLVAVFLSLFDILGLMHGDLPFWPIVLPASMLVVLLAAGTVGFTIFFWIRRFWSLARRIYYTLITVSLVIFVWFLYLWNLLGNNLSL